MKTEELDAIETRVLVWSKEVNPKRREDALALIAEIRGHASDADLQIDVLRKALEKHVCVRAIAGDGMNAVDYYPLDEDECPVCVALKPKVVESRVDDRCCCTITVGEGPCPACRKHSRSRSRNQ